MEKREESVKELVSLLSITDFEKRYQKNVLPLDEAGETDVERISIALVDATGVILSHLPWLIDETGKGIIPEIPLQFENALLSICADIAFIRLTDTVSSSEDARKKYDESVRLLEKIDKEHKGTLSGGHYHHAEIVDESSDETLIDKRYFKKGKF